jgi:hypothetical protein
MIEELLELLVDKVDRDLFKSIVLKDLKPSNVQDSAEVGLLHSWINKCIITLFNQPLEQAVKACSGNTTSSVGCLLAGLAFGYPFSTNLDTGFAEGLDHCNSINTKELSNLPWNITFLGIFTFSLVVTAFS